MDRQIIIALVMRNVNFQMVMQVARDENVRRILFSAFMLFVRHCKIIASYYLTSDMVSSFLITE